MPAVSKKQQRFMGMVHALNKGEINPSDVSKDVQDVAKDMKKKDAKDFASTKHKGLPMKKEQMINRLKEMIKQELSEYTYGVGDIVKDVNPSCLHYGAIGKVKEVNPEYVTFVVTNNGDNFSKGQTLEKSHDQMKKVNEGSMDWEKKHFPWANEKEQMMIAKLVFSAKNGIEDIVKQQKKNPSSFKNHIKSMVKKGLHESINENRDFEKLYDLFSKKDYFNLKGQMKTQLGNWKRALDKGDKGAQKFSEKDVIDSVNRMVKSRAKFTYDELEKAIKKKDIRTLKSKLRHDQPYSIAIFNQITGKKLPKTTRDIHSFLDNEFINEINESTARNDKSIGTKNYKGVGWFWPNDGWKHYLRDVENAGRKEVHDLWLKAGFEVKKDNRGIPHFDIKPNERSKAMDIVNKLDRSKKYKHANESINEANPKDTIATIDMVNALLKIKSPMSRQTLDALKMMVRHYGLDNIKKEVQRDARKFYKSLQKMEKGLTQDIELESIIKEDYFVNSGQDFSKNFLTGIDLVISQANNLRGQLAKHPVKRDVNKLKAVQTIYKKFLQPSIDKENDRFKSVDLTRLKDFLKDGKFRNALEYEILSALDTRSYNSNSYYFLDDKHKELIKKLTRSLKDITNKLDKGQFESVNEASVSQVRSTISRVKKQLMQKWAKKGGYENFGQKELRNLRDKFKENPYGSPEERKISDMLSAFDNWAMNYSGDMRESVNEGKGVDKIMKIVDTQSFGKLAGQTVDTLSASLFKQVYDKASQGAKDKINQMNERQLLVFMNKLWMRFGKGLSGQMMS